jgi:hypothetical protein
MSIRWSLAAALLAAGCATSSSGSGGSVQESTGCFEVGEALSTFQDFADGLDNKTLTEGDMEADLKKIADKLEDAASLGPAPIVAAATAGATNAGQIRAALANHDDPSTIATKAGDLRSQMDSLAATCGH